MNPTTLKALPGYIIVQPQEGVKTDEGIILAVNPEGEAATGTVVSACTHDARGMQQENIRAGDRVVYAAYSGASTRVTGQLLIAVPLDRVSAVVTQTN